MEHHEPGRAGSRAGMVGAAIETVVRAHDEHWAASRRPARGVTGRDRKRSQQGASALCIECIRTRLHSMVIVSVRYSPKFFAAFEDNLAYNFTRFAMAIAASSRAAPALARRMQ